MLSKKSRYQPLRFFDPRADGMSVFQGLRARPIGPATGVVEHEVQEGDRLDHLARHYYNDDRQWPRIVDANPAFSFGPDMLGKSMAGQVILIPKLKE